MGYICILTYETSCDAHHNHFPGAIVQWLGGYPTFYLYFYLSILVTKRSDHL